jgi:CubicO group peptidase (beta-lactamase class C family)
LERCIRSAEPGKLYKYSGEGFLYLGRVIEQITRMSLQDFAKQEIFDPLGMAHTSYVWNEDYAANGAAGHDSHEFANPRRQRTEANGGASLLTTGRDYATFLCAILNCQLLQKETIDQMVSPQVQATEWDSEELNEFIYWGWGWGIQPGDTGHGFWHWGNNGDLKVYTVTYRDRGVGITFFTNSENGLAITEDLVSLVVDDHQYALDWLDIERYDDPQRTARLSVVKTFLNQRAEVGGGAGKICRPLRAPTHLSPRRQVVL